MSIAFPKPVPRGRLRTEAFSYAPKQAFEEGGWIKLVLEDHLSTIVLGFAYAEFNFQGSKLFFVPETADTRFRHATPKVVGKVELIKSEATPRHSVFKFMLQNEKDRLHWQKFTTFLSTFNKTYTSKTEYLGRFKNFRKNLAVIKAFQKNEEGSAQYGITRFADMSQEEFRSNVLIPEWTDTGYPDVTAADILNEVAPDSWDWRDHGAVTPVKNQGNCGSCWAFSTTGNVEGQWAIKRGKLLNLSEQELVDCDKLDLGCNGGLPSNAYKEIMRLGGLEPERDYPYDGHNDKCTFNKSDASVFISSSVKISPDEEQMKVWLYKNGPISIGIDAMAMQFYWGGIAHPWRIFCNPNKLNHGVLIVGYGVKGTEPFWIIKNSWGPGWGEKGYYLIYRGQGVCGLNKMATSAIVD